MKTKLKSLIAIALCAVGLAAFSEETPSSQGNPWKIGATEEDNVTAWTNGVGGLTIEGSGAMKDFDVYATRPWSTISTVNIDLGVTSIGEGAFCNCSGLTSVTIPSSVTSIGEGAFCNCSKLESVTIPSSVTSIGAYAFDGCSELESATISEGVTSIGVGMFYNCSGLTSITIPSSVTSIGNYAFLGCSSMKTVYVSNNGDIDALKQMLTASGFDITNVTFEYVVPLVVKNVQTATHWPWDGKIDVTCDLTGAGEVTLSIALTTNDITVCEATTLTGATVIDLGAGCTTNGVRLVWDAKADFEAAGLTGFNTANAKIKVTASTMGSAVDPEAGGVQLWAGGPYWAECNVGATNPEDYGNLYLFSDDKAKEAAESLGAGWRLPTKDEFTNLLDKCDSQWDTTKRGWKFTGKDTYASKSVFFRAAGRDYYNDGRKNANYEGNYWSSTEGDPNSAYILYFSYYSSNPKIKVSSYEIPDNALSVRAVRDAPSPALETSAESEAFAFDLRMDVTLAGDTTIASVSYSDTAWGAEAAANVTLGYTNETTGATGELATDLSGSGEANVSLPTKNGAYKLTHSMGGLTTFVTFTVTGYPTLKIPAAGAGYTYVVSNETAELTGELVDGTNTYVVTKGDRVKVYFTLDEHYEWTGEFTNPLDLGAIESDRVVSAAELPTAQLSPLGSEGNPWEIGSPEAESVVAFTNGDSNVYFKPARAAVSKTGLETITNAMGKVDFQAKLISADGSETNGLVMAVGASGTAYGSLADALAAEEPSYELLDVEGADVAFNAMGGVHANGREVVTNFCASSYALPEVKRDGYALVGWFDGWTNGAAQVTGGQDLIAYEPHTLYARWQSNKPTLSGGELYVPDATNGVPVTEIAAKQYVNQTSLRYVTTPLYLKTIGQRAFMGCTALEKLTITAARSYDDLSPVTVTVGQNAFSGCSSLETVYIAAEIESIGQSAFQNCANLKKIVFLGDGTITYGASAFYRCGYQNGTGALKVYMSSAFQTANAALIQKFKDWNTQLKIIEKVDVAPVEGGSISIGDFNAENLAANDRRLAVLVKTSVQGTPDPDDVGVEYATALGGPWSPLSAEKTANPDGTVLIEIKVPEGSSGFFRAVVK